MNNTSAQNEILGLEHQYWQAMKDNDIETAVSLTRFPCLLTSPKGLQRVSEESYRQMMSSHKPESFKNIEMKSPQVDMLGDDTAVVSYSIESNGMKMLDVSTWVREDDKWRCAFHAENPLN